MYRIEQKSFEESAVLDYHKNEPLIIHAQEQNKATTLVVFVHGLNGYRYGRNSTWRLFPGFIFDDFKDCDVGMYEYRTGIYRWKFWDSVDVKVEAEVFGDIIRDMNQYERVVLVAHSLGGILSKGAITHLLQTNQLTRDLTLILMATPQAGSLMTPLVFTPFSADARALRAHNGYVTHIDDIFSTHVENDPEVDPKTKTHIPTYAVVGSSDFWVDRLSASLNLSPKQRKTVRGSHTQIVKPKNKQTGAYQFVHDVIESALNRPISPKKNDRERIRPDWTQRRASSGISLFSTTHLLALQKSAFASDFCLISPR